jgi:hypothetical protein
VTPYSQSSRLRSSFVLLHTHLVHTALYKFLWPRLKYKKIALFENSINTVPTKRRIRQFEEWTCRVFSRSDGEGIVSRNYVGAISSKFLLFFFNSVGFKGELKNFINKEVVPGRRFDVIINFKLLAVSYHPYSLQRLVYVLYKASNWSWVPGRLHSSIVCNQITEEKSFYKMRVFEN